MRAGHGPIVGGDGPIEARLGLIEPKHGPIDAEHGGSAPRHGVDVSEQQACDVQTGDQEHHARRREQRQKRRFGGADDVCPECTHVRGPSSVGLGIRGREPRVDPLQIVLGLGGRDTRPHAADGAQIVLRPVAALG